MQYVHLGNKHERGKTIDVFQFASCNGAGKEFESESRGQR